MSDAEIALAPISDEEPCGPDLDLEGDSKFMNYVAATEGLLPAKSYFEFDRKTVDFAATIAAGEALLQRTYDLRLLSLLAKLAILNRDFRGFTRRVETMAWLLDNHWDGVHPRAEDGDYSNRLVQLSALDDAPACVLPLQYASLLETRRDGAVVYRAQMIALGDAKARDGETLASPSAIDRIFATVELDELTGVLQTAEGLASALTRIRAATMDHVGPENATLYRGLAPLADKIVEFLREGVRKRDPGAASARIEGESPAQDAPLASGGAPAPATPLDTFEGVDAALGAALGYFAHREPSSPALLLIRQARESLGRNLYDVMRLLAPNHADNARVFVGPDSAFTVPVSALSDAPTLAIARSDPEPSPNRAAALAQIDAVAAHMRKSEPSSPLPYLLERARALASRDFVSLLHEVLPEDDIQSMKNGR